jgi:hypothetical protein
MIFARTPETVATISTVAFSVSISAMAWSFSTFSPSFFNQVTSFPSVMSKPIEGRITSVATRTSLRDITRDSKRVRDRFRRPGLRRH